VEPLMLAYIVKRLLLMIPTLLGVLLLTFAVIQFVPGGPVEQYLAEAKAGAGGAGAETGGLSYRGAQGVDPKRLEAIKALYGFDKPAHERFVQMLGQFARFDLGKSFFQNKAVTDLILEKLPVSISLGRRCARARALTSSPRCWCWSAMQFRGLCWAWCCWSSLAGNCSGFPCAV